MKTLHVTNTNIGGAWIAAYRLHTALRKAGVDSRTLVRRKGTNDPTVEEVGSFTPVDSCSLVVGKGRDKKPQQPIIRQLNNCRARLPVRARGWLGANLTKALGMEGCSLNIFPTGLHKVLNASDADVIHLHWINNEMISIKEIAKIKKPIVWTLHDMWPLCGAEHHSSASYWALSPQSPEPSSQLPATSRPLWRFLRSFAAKKTDLNDLTTSTRRIRRFNAVAYAVNSGIFRLKQRAWKQLRVSFVAPSNWMADQVRKSELFADAPVTVIPNGLDLDVFKPMDRTACRKKLGLPLDKKLILFGAYNPLDPNKGLDLLEDALRKLPEAVRRGAGVVVFGCKGDWEISGLETYWLGAVKGEQEMAEVYNAGNCTCVPSRRESFGYTAAESLACGIPVAAFRTSGLVDIVDHQGTGWLAKPFDADDFSQGLLWILEKNQRSDVGSQISESCRRRTEALFSSETLIESHRAVYQKLVAIRFN